MEENRIYEFTLFLKNINEITSHLEESLYEVGCDDALIVIRNGEVYLDFSRKADSMTSAVLSAIKDVESAGFKCCKRE